MKKIKIILLVFSIFVCCFFSTSIYADDSHSKELDEENYASEILSNSSDPYVYVTVENTFTKNEYGKYKYEVHVVTYSSTGTCGTAFSRFYVKSSPTGSEFVALEDDVEYYYSGSTNNNQTLDYFYSSKLLTEVYVFTKGTRVCTYEKDWLSVNDYRKTTAVREASSPELDK